ncbi:MULTISPECIES: hypothetical protein [unclassified Duganella]|uniref:hypothetical protein n=1 Tax=unclassified Duganella TaxID=2636909 RepID=UPI000888ED2A|nr:MULTISPECIES: hypothetical protein [unclassified Duganella]SDH44830.1 hypothetical protein SAMN05216320_113121 [Duganella sp. OV458]SDK57686.1 hypothetical protein SAMN05428973_11341 [Duganella sp. OV510]
MKVLFALMLVSTAALADDAALLKCRQLEDGPVRLACYNAIPLGVSKPGPVASAGSAPATPLAAAAPAQPDPVQEFGRQKTVQLESIESSIVGEFDGWVPNQRIRLANGQVWRIADGSDEAMSVTNPKVKLERGAMGAIYMDIDGSRTAPRVKREK